MKTPSRPPRPSRPSRPREPRQEHAPTAESPLRRSGLLWVPTLYFAEGLPYVLVMTVAVIMYKDLGASNAGIAFFTSWLYLPWVIKPLWSPFVDMFSTKRRWIILMQWAIAGAMGLAALTAAAQAYFILTLLMFALTALLSATHDIAADGFYMLGLTERRQSLLVGIRTMFYRLAMIACQGGVVMLAGYLAHSRPMATAWQLALAALSLTFALLAAWHTLILPRPAADRPDLPAATAATGRFRTVWSEFATTVATFFTKPHILPALLFMLLYRFPEAQLVKLISPFLRDDPSQGGLGLLTEHVGFAYGTVGIIALIAGGIAGGWFVSVRGLRRALMPMAWSMSLTCATFLYLSYFPTASLLTVNLCVALEQFGYGFGTTAYTLYLINYAKGPRATSHYAIATGLMALGMMLPGMAAGWLQQHLGYRHFFLYTMAACAVTILVTRLAARHISPAARS